MARALATSPQRLTGIAGARDGDPDRGPDATRRRVAAMRPMAIARREPQIQDLESAVAGRARGGVTNPPPDRCLHNLSPLSSLRSKSSSGHTESVLRQHELTTFEPTRLSINGRRSDSKRCRSNRAGRSPGAFDRHRFQLGSRTRSSPAPPGDRCVSLEIAAPCRSRLRRVTR